ncbi:MAG TPA: MFS transporter [Frankiaceae bacterium]|nr:MFS transporter [Frankiaceae bacterium]
MTAKGDDTTAAPHLPHARYREVLLNRSFQALSLASFISIAGDQIARVALSVLVYDRTSSAALTGLTYALSYLPTVLGGTLLSGLADRRPRRNVMIACDVVRAVLVLLMAVAAMPLPALLALLAAVTLCEVPFDAARGAMMPDVLPGERYAIGGAIGQVVLQSAMVVGFAVGGVLLVVASPRQLLALDALTFVLSALLVRAVPFGMRAATVEVPGGTRRAFDDVRLARRVIFGDPRLRPLVLLAWAMSAAAIAPEALAVPYAREANAGSAMVGLLLAAGPVGNVLAGLALARLPEPRRVPLMWPLATLAAAPLALCLLHPPIPVVLGLVAVSGAGTAYNLVAMVRFVMLVEPEKRGRALGLAGTGLAVSQGIAIAGAGVLGDLLDPAIAVGAAGVAGLVAALVWGPSLSRQRAPAG